MRLLPDDPAVRRMAVAGLVNTSGNGIFMTLSALYFTRIVGFSVVQVGTGLSIAAAAAIFAGIPVGHLADRRGGREVQIVLLLATTAATALLLLVQEWWQFVLVTSLVAVLDQGSNAVRQVMIAELTAGADRAATKAYLRSVTNLGITIGTGIAAFALHVDTRSAYVVVLYVDVATYAVAALLTAGLPRHVAPERGEGDDAPHRSSMTTALRDLPFVTVVLVVGVLQMHYWILEIAIPLWVVDHTAAPHALVSVVLVVNTVMAVTCQVAVAKRVTDLRAAVRASMLAGLLLLVACVVLGLAHGLSPVAASVVLLVGAFVGVLGELLQASGAFLIAFELPPEHAMGQYQGVWGLSMSLSSFAAPTVMALLPLGLGLPGWVILGLILFGAALALRPAVARAERARDERPIGSSVSAPGTLTGE